MEEHAFVSEPMTFQTDHCAHEKTSELIGNLYVRKKNHKKCDDHTKRNQVNFNNCYIIICKGILVFHLNIMPLENH